MKSAFCLLFCWLISFNIVQEQEQQIEVGDLVRILYMKRQQDIPELAGKGPDGDFDAFVVEISEDGKKIAYQRVTANSRRAGTISMKYVELIRKGRRPRKPRKWTSASGNNSIEAVLVEIKKDAVVLKRKNGKTTTAKIDSLSETDRAYIDRMRDSSLERKVVVDSPDVPFGSRRKSLASKKWNWQSHPVGGTLPTGTFQAAELPVPISIDRLGMTSSDANSGSFGSPGDSDSRLAGKRTSGRIAGSGRGMRGHRRFGGSFHVWESTFSDDGETLFVLANQLEGQNCAVVAIDLTKNEVISAERLDAFALAISPNGQRVALVQTGNDQERGELIFRRVGHEEIMKRYPLEGPFENGGGYRICRGTFLNDSTLVTVGNEIVGVNIETGKGFATRPFPLGTMIEDFAMSPNRKQIAVMTHQGVLVFDASRGKSAGSIAFPESFFGQKCAFSPDGNRLAVFSRGSSLINLFDLTTGKLADSLAVEETGIDSRISWPDERFILLGNKVLMDLELKTKVWEFEVADGIDSGLAHIRDHWYLYSDSGSNICPIKLPLEDIRGQLNDFDVDDAKVLGEGDTFSIKVDLPFSDDENDKTFDQLRGQLEKRKLVFEENSANVFVCNVEDGKRESAKVRVGGTLRDPELEDVSWTTTYSCIGLRIDGDLRWEKRTVNSPNRGNIVRRGNETLDATIARLASPKPSQFRGNSLPQQFFSFPGNESVLGRSTVSLGGVSASR